MTDPATEQVRHALAELRRELDHDLGQVRDLRAVGERLDEIDELRADLERQMERVRNVAVITLVGATGAGKSTLLNALVGRRVATEGESRPTTRAPVIYRPRDADVSVLLENLPGEPPTVEDYDPDAGGPWREQILIDAPDINSVAEEHRKVVRTLAQRSDVLLVVAHRQSVSELSTVAFVDAFAGRRGMLFVLNRADELAEASREKLLAQLRELAAERWGAADAPVLAVSARQAQAQPASPGWSELCHHLQELVRDGVLGRVRRHNAIGTSERLSEVFGALQQDVAPRLDELQETLAGGLETWREKVASEVDERLELRLPHVKEMLWGEGARSWDGPGGWALRTGGLSTLGLGAGAMLARRNPLLAAGAALGGVAVDRAREGFRGRHLRDAAGILPGAGELDGWYRTDLGAARLAAADLGDSPTALGVPGAEELGERVADVTAEAWERLVEKELPRAAQRGVRFFLRWAVDLPVYALAGWVVWTAGKGFWEGSYTGLDFLVNAALILFAWLFVTRILVRALLGTRAARLLAQVQLSTEQGLAQTTDSVQRDAQRELGDRARALERLAACGERWKTRILG